jgi:hypothetical protein
MKPETPVGLPWWRYGHVWLVIAGPAVVVVAALVTAWIAMRSPDPVLAEDHSRRGLQSSQALANNRALTPALQGRNHAATPDKR